MLKTQDFEMRMLSMFQESMQPDFKRCPSGLNPSQDLARCDGGEKQLFAATASTTHLHRWKN